jgi:ATP-binding cassette subfamily B (MDR/TAP) protein 1
VDALLLLLSCVGAAAAGAALPLFTLVFGSVLDTLGAAATPGSIRDAISSLALDFLYLALGAGAAAWVEVAAGAAGGARLARRLRLAYLRAALRQDQAFYDVGGTAAALLQGLNEDADDVQSAVGDKVQGEAGKRAGGGCGGEGWC